MSLETGIIRPQFPALERPVIFLDNPAGTQIAKQSIERINRYLVEGNANHDGLFEASRKSDEVLALMVEGLNNAQIAGRLTASSSTIKSHVSTSCPKWGLPVAPKQYRLRCAAVSFPNSHIPQMADANMPRSMDVVGAYLL